MYIERIGGKIRKKGKEISSAQFCSSFFFAWSDWRSPSDFLWICSAVTECRVQHKRGHKPMGSPQILQEVIKTNERINPKRVIFFPLRSPPIFLPYQAVSFMLSFTMQCHNAGWQFLHWH